MSFDPFEARLQFLGLLRKLNASQQSIQTVVSYALKYGRKCGEDLWDCIVEECGKVCQLRVLGSRPNALTHDILTIQGSLNTRINILYFLDTLCDPQTTSSLIPSASSSSTTDFPYTALLSRDVVKLVGLVVPGSKEGILNLLSTKQVSRSKEIVVTRRCVRLIVV
jgi:CTD kinase subunit gamma